MEKKLPVTSTPPVKLLQEIYRIYDEFITGFDLVCKKSCATCCTRNITATSLETRLILQFWEKFPEKDRFEHVRSAGNAPRFQPHMTLNQIADRCARNLDIPDEGADPEAAACPLLLDGACLIYDVRPFGCRAMVSQTSCAATGEAEMPDHVLAVNNVFLQYIEAVDAQGFQGNLIDTLLFMTSPGAPTPPLTNNHPLTVLMIPPEYRKRLHPLLTALSRAHATLSC